MSPVRAGISSVVICPRKSIVNPAFIMTLRLGLSILQKELRSTYCPPLLLAMNLVSELTLNCVPFSGLLFRVGITQPNHPQMLHGVFVKKIPRESMFMPCLMYTVIFVGPSHCIIFMYM